MGELYSLHSSHYLSFDG